ncbi:MAG: SCP2 sterol-binding domain-containing protein [Solirubrobacteraceae bacterium]
MRRWFADRKTEALARWVSAASDQRLQWVMCSRFRGVLLWQIFRTIAQRAQPDAHLNAVVEFRITGRRDGGIDRYQLIFGNGQCRTARRGREPALTLEFEPVAFLRLVGGIHSPQRLLLTRKLKLRGDVMLALALTGALKLPGESLLDSLKRSAERLFR